MSRSLHYLSRGLLGIAFVGSLGFGARQALAYPQLDTIACDAYNDPFAHTMCENFCRSRGLYGGGWCSSFSGTCQCAMPD
jgi:hypothetical protein